MKSTQIQYISHMAYNKKPLISIIIPTFNSEKHIEKCLASIKKQTYQPIETIIVDQSSTDSTREIVKKFKVTIFTLPKPKFYSPPTKSRNAGAKKSKGEILVHIDSDMILTPKLVQEIADKLTSTQYGALIIHEEDITKGFWSKCKAFERRCYWGNDSIESARAVKRSIFEKVGGYDETLSSGEDFDIHRRYKQYAKIGFCDQVVKHNLGSLGFMTTIKKKYNYGKTADKYFTKHQTSGQSILKEQFLSYFHNVGLFFRSPVIGTGSLILKMSEFGAGGLGLLRSKI